MREIVLVAHNVRSAHNVGSLLRTADGLGVKKVYLTGYSPYPLAASDPRLPHLAAKIDKQINKTALGAATTVAWEHAPDIAALISRLRGNQFEMVALEQTPLSLKLNNFKPAGHVALMVGNEVDGLDKTVLDLADVCLEIPMLGQKESLNVSVAAAIGLYHLRFVDNLTP